MPTFVPLEKTLGALLLAAILYAILYGMNSAQVFLYYMKHSARDTTALKLLVAALWILDTACLILTCNTLFIPVVKNFGEYSADLHPPWSFGPGGMIVVIVSLCIQNFYSYRIYRLSRSVIIPTAISVISFGAAGFTITFCIKYIQSRFISDVFHNMRLEKLAAGLHIPCNALITISMVFYHIRNREEVKSTNSAITSLTFYSINCGTLNLVFSIVSFVFLLKAPNTLIFVPLFLSIIGVYFSSFMTNLNCRDHLSQILETSYGVITARRVSISPKSPATAYQLSPLGNTLNMKNEGL
ncbi:hypothetical protein BJV78DRAFT_1242577 [Lactifluus subvellereus]|nr:hypothetical protein BJV78DRAFT_1242577 [Lactifluus subvellereus]